MKTLSRGIKHPQVLKTAGRESKKNSVFIEDTRGHTARGATNKKKRLTRYRQTDGARISER